MKRSKPLRSAAELRRTVGLQPGKRLTRSTPLSPKSKRQRKREQEYAVVRVQVLIRDGGRCRRCGVEATDVHHLRGRVGADMTNPDLLVSLCRPCHDHVGAHPAESYEQGWMLRRVS